MNNVFRFFVVLLLVASSLSGKIIEKIVVEGIPQEQVASVVALLPLTEGRGFGQSELTRTIRSLYGTGRFSDVSVDESPGSEDGAVILTIKLQSVLSCESVEIVGVRRSRERALKDSLGIERGMLITDALIHEKRQWLRRYYRGQGNLNVSVEYELVETDVPGYATLRFFIDEGPDVRIDAISFEGNDAFRDARLRRKFKTKRRHMFSSGRFNEDEFPRHLDTLMDFYHNRGFLDAQVVATEIKDVPDSDRISIEITVEEGPRYITGEFFFTNNEVFSDEQLQRAVTMPPGRPFGKMDFMMQMNELSNVYRNDGYLRAHLSPSKRYRGDTVDVVFSITEGLPSVVGVVRVEGNVKTREQVIRREIRMMPGEVYNQALVMRSLRDIMALKYFDNVYPDIVPREDNSEVVDLIFHVVEKENIGQFTAGLTYSGASESTLADTTKKHRGQFGGNFSVSIPNFRGAGEQLDASFEINRYKKSFSLGFMNPWFMDRPLTFSSRLIAEKYEYGYSDGRFDMSRHGIEVGFSRRLSWPDDYWRGSIRYALTREIRNTDNSREEERLDLNIVEKGVASRVTLGLTRDDTDRPYFPDNGSVFHIGTTFGGAGFNQYNRDREYKGWEEYNYVRTIASYDWYMPLFWKFTLGTKAKVGVIGTLDGERPSLGWSDLFDVGGVYYSGMVRGYNEGGLGRNTHMMVFSNQLRFPVVDGKFYVGGFVDHGNSFNSVSSMDVSQLRSGAGFGFRLLLPMVGLIGFDFAKPIGDGGAFTSDGHSTSRFETYFLMNTEF